MLMSRDELSIFVKYNYTCCLFILKVSFSILAVHCMVEFVKTQS